MYACMYDMYARMHARVCMHACMYVHVLYMYIYICIHICMYTYRYVCLGFGGLGFIGCIYIDIYVCSMTTTATTGNEAAPPNEKVTYKRGG